MRTPDIYKEAFHARRQCQELIPKQPKTPVPKEACKRTLCKWQKKDGYRRKAVPK